MQGVNLAYQDKIKSYLCDESLLCAVSGIRLVNDVNSIDLLCDLYIKHKLHTIVYMSQDSLGFVA